MKSEFRSELDFHMKTGSDMVYILDAPLIYYSERLEREIIVPAEFNTDLSSVPRVPIIYWLWGARAHREGVLHDYAFRIDSNPVVSFMIANWLFLEAQQSRGKNLFVRQPMFYGVVIGGHPSYHKKYVGDTL